MVNVWDLGKQGGTIMPARRTDAVHGFYLENSASPSLSRSAPVACDLHSLSGLGHFTRTCCKSKKALRPHVDDVIFINVRDSPFDPCVCCTVQYGPGTVQYKCPVLGGSYVLCGAVASVIIDWCPGFYSIASNLDRALRGISQTQPHAVTQVWITFVN